MFAGSDGPGGIHFDDPRLAQSLSIVADFFILFAGRLDTNWQSIRSVHWQGLSLSTPGVFVTAVNVIHRKYYSILLMARLDMGRERANL